MMRSAATSTTRSEATACARRVLELLPPLRQWVAGRVQASGAEAGLSLRQFAALHGIREGACSPGELARLWQVTPAVLTGVIDRLERRGLVRRESDPQDRRRLVLALTEEGLAASRDVEQALLDDLAAQLASASPRELAELERALELLHGVLLTLHVQERDALAPAPGAAVDPRPADWRDATAETAPRALVGVEG